MADAGIPVDVIARLNDTSPRYVGQYLARHAETVRGGPAPTPLVLHDRPRPRPASLPDPDRRFRVRLEELEAFLAAHGRRPHLSADTGNRTTGSEWALSHWLTIARSDERHGRLAEHRARWLGRVLPSWRVDDRSIEFEAQWRQNLVQLLTFIDAHGRRPVDSPQAAEAGERQLADWLSAQRGALRAGSLDRERRFWLDRQVPGWTRTRVSPRPT